MRMATEWVEVADTAIKIGFGASAGGLSALLLERARDRREQRRRHEEMRRALLVNPIIAFVDDLMAAVGEVYWSSVDGKLPRLEEKMMFFRERQGAVEARVAAIHDPVLAEKWPHFTRKVIEVRIRVEKRDLGEAYDKMQEAFALGADILSLLIR